MEGSKVISINFRDPRPIYEQIKDGMRRLIVSGALPAGSKISSVRDGDRTCHKPEHDPARVSRA